MEIRKMSPGETARLAELDRRERVTQYYRVNDGVMESMDVDWNVPQWDIEAKQREWAPITEGYRNMWGAFHNGRLIGFAVYRSSLTTDTGQLSLLHITRDFRGKGIGTILMNKVIEKAKEDHRKALYVSSCPSRNTVDFYSRRGFRLTDEPNLELFEMEPEDIHMIMHLTY